MNINFVLKRSRSDGGCSLWALEAWQRGVEVPRKLQ